MEVRAGDAHPWRWKRADSWELGLVWLFGAICFAMVPVVLGGIGLGWDALNHHFYLGWIAEHPRFNQDLFAAGYQTFQWPYLYWPLYKMAASGASGVSTGVVLALLQSTAIPAVWMVSRHLLPGVAPVDIAFRILAVALAFLSGLTLSLLESTPNDMLGAIPLLWSIAIGLQAWQREDRGLLAWSGLLAGLAVACKLSNGPIGLAMPVLWVLGSRSIGDGLRRVVVACSAAAAGFMLAYGWWGWQLWQHFGNPLYPFNDGYFEGLRHALGWRT